MHPAAAIQLSPLPSRPALPTACAARPIPPPRSAVIDYISVVPSPPKEVARCAPRAPISRSQSGFWRTTAFMSGIPWLAGHVAITLVQLARITDYSELGLDESRSEGAKVKPAMIAR